MNDAGTNRTMPQKCPQCGASLPKGVLAGLCPACLLQQGAAADTATRPASQALRAAADRRGGPALSATRNPWLPRQRRHGRGVQGPPAGARPPGGAEDPARPDQLPTRASPSASPAKPAPWPASAIPTSSPSTSSDRYVQSSAGVPPASPPGVPPGLDTRQARRPPHHLPPPPLLHHGVCGWREPAPAPEGRPTLPARGAADRAADLRRPPVRPRRGRRPPRHQARERAGGPQGPRQRSPTSAWPRS